MYKLTIDGQEKVAGSYRDVIVGIFEFDNSNATSDAFSRLVNCGEYYEEINGKIIHAYKVH